MYATWRMPAPVHDPSRIEDRYEPLPSLGQLPGWIWRRLPRAAKVGVALLPVLIAGLVIALGPGIDRSKDERAQAEAERLERLQAERVARLRAEQRPRLRRGSPAGTDLAARGALLAAAAAAIETDARRRAAAGELDGPISRVACEPYPRTLSGRGADQDPERSTGSYACLAVTQDVPESERGEASLIGHPYRMKIDFGSGAYAFCKVAGRPGEGSISRSRPVTVPEVCGGR